MQSFVRETLPFVQRLDPVTFVASQDGQGGVMLDGAMHVLVKDMNPRYLNQVQ